MQHGAFLFKCTHSDCFKSKTETQWRIFCGQRGTRASPIEVAAEAAVVRARRTVCAYTAFARNAGFTKCDSSFLRVGVCAGSER